MFSRFAMLPGRTPAAGSFFARRALGVALTLGSLVMGGCATPSARQPGTPMKTSCPASVELPTVEECLEEASRIDEELLMNCMRRQCRDITVTCSEWSRKECEVMREGPDSVLLAFTLTTSSGMHHRFYPVKETHWCEEPASRECIIKAVIHELAHSCGWDHGQGHKVPGNNPKRKPPPECACADENGARTSCE